MSQAFNPYREWLDVASRDKTPSYYDLLGLRPLEADMAKVEAAYQRQAAKLAAHLSGANAQVAQRLMGELAEARMTLLTPTAKRAYDAALAAVVQATVQSPAAQSPAPLAPRPLAPQPVSPQPVSPQPVAGQPSPTAPAYAQPQPAPRQAAEYTSPAPGYAAPAYGAGQGYGPAPVYPAAPSYPAWQGQPGMAAAPVAGAAPGYYAPPAAAFPGTVEPVVSDSPSIPAIRPRRARRRSSPVPAAAGVLVVFAALAGMWWYTQGHKLVAVAQPDENRSRPTEKKPDASKQIANSRPSSTRPDNGRVDARHKDEAGMPGAGGGDRSGRPKPKPPAVMPAPAITADPSAADANMPAGDGDERGMAKPATENPKAELAKPQPDKPEPDSRAPEKPAPEKPAPAKPATASPEELATVGKLLKAAREALASRDLSKARDLLAEATIEATAPDTTAEIGRVETLASYVELFWDAVRKTLPKIELEELTINGSVLAVVEADADHLVIRAAGKTHEYTWQKLPRDLAYHLANRWLAPDDAVRNLVLASFEIVDPKGDRNQAERLLDAASAARLNVQPLTEELQIARGE